MNKDICGNCIFINLYRKYINNSYECNYHHLTVKPEQLGCYKIQFNKKSDYENY